MLMMIVLRKGLRVALGGEKKTLGGCQIAPSGLGKSRTNVPKRHGSVWADRMLLGRNGLRGHPPEDFLTVLEPKRASPTSLDWLQSHLINATFFNDRQGLGLFVQ
jgi:hypothetical protein